MRGRGWGGRTGPCVLFLVHLQIIRVFRVFRVKRC